MRRGLPPVAGTVKMVVAVRCSESPAPSLREKYTRPDFRPTNSARTLPGTISVVFSRRDLDGDDARRAFGDHVPAVGRNAVLVEIHRARAGLGRQADHAMTGGGVYPLEWRRLRSAGSAECAPAHPRSPIKLHDTARQIIRMESPRYHAGRRAVSEYAQF